MIGQHLVPVFSDTTKYSRHKISWKKHLLSLSFPLQTFCSWWSSLSITILIQQLHKIIRLVFSYDKMVIKKIFSFIAQNRLRDTPTCCTCTHTCSEVQYAVMLIVDCQDNVCHSVCDLVIHGEVKWSHTNWPDHIFNFWVVSDHPEVFNVVLNSRWWVSADTLWRDVM